MRLINVRLFRYKMMKKLIRERMFDLRVRLC